MFSNAVILYGGSFWKTAATQHCGRPQGIYRERPWSVRGKISQQNQQ